MRELAAYQTIFLDAGGVLIDPNWDLVASALARRGVNVSGGELREAEPHAKRALDRAAHVARSDDDGRGEDLFHLVLTRLGIGRTAATDAALAEIRGYHAESNLWESPIEGAIEAVAELRDRGHRLVVVSNSNGTIGSLFERLGWSNRFDLLVDSAVEGVEKPDPRLFRIALARAGASAESTIHIGDLYEIDVVGARAAGLDAMLIDRGDLYPDVDCRRAGSLAALCGSVA